MKDEQRLVGMMAEYGSTSCRIYRDLGITASLIKGVYHLSTFIKLQQATLANVVRAARFESFERNRWFLVQHFTVPGRRKPDSFDRLLALARIGRIPGESEALILFLMDSAARAATVNPGVPAPRRAAHRAEIEFPAFPERPEGEISLDRIGSKN